MFHKIVSIACKKEHFDFMVQSHNCYTAQRWCTRTASQTAQQARLPKYLFLLCTSRSELIVFCHTRILSQLPPGRSVADSVFTVYLVLEKNICNFDTTYTNAFIDFKQACVIIWRNWHTSNTSIGINPFIWQWNKQKVSGCFGHKHSIFRQNMPSHQ